MFRRLSFLAGLILLFSVSAKAQDQFQVFGGYSYMHVGANPSFNSNGWELSGQYKFMDWLGVVGDFDGHYGTTQGDSVATHDILFGPQVSWPARVSPFAHLLMGAAHISEGGVGDTSFAMGLGAGIDTRIAPAFYWRIFQVDYIPTYFFGHTQSDMRISTGIVFHF